MDPIKESDITYRCKHGHRIKSVTQLCKTPVTKDGRLGIVDPRSASSCHKPIETVTLSMKDFNTLIAALSDAGVSKPIEYGQPEVWPVGSIVIINDDAVDPDDGEPSEFGGCQATISDTYEGDNGYIEYIVDIIDGEEGLGFQASELTLVKLAPQRIKKPGYTVSYAPSDSFGNTASVNATIGPTNTL